MLMEQFCIGERNERKPTSGLEPLTCYLRVITQALHGCAGGCNSRIFRGVSFPCLAECCTVLRSRWYQSGINCTLVFTSTKTASCWFYILLRKAPKAPIAMLATAPRFTVGCNSSQL